MFIGKKFAHILLCLALLTIYPQAVFACATCGCSELCPLALVQEDSSGKSAKNPGGLLGDSIWGSVILKMAYQRDAQLQKIRRHVRGVNTLASGGVAGAVVGTLPQTILSETTLNPPKPPQSDSYLPGGLGLGLNGVINIAVEGGILLNWNLNRKIRARQKAIRSRVEVILSHLEYSAADCPQAQSDLTEIIGARAARDCIQLWRSSHAMASLQKDKTISDESINNEIGKTVSFNSGADQIAESASH
jgi:hypothetical protein